METQIDDDTSLTLHCGATLARSMDVAAGGPPSTTRRSPQLR
jgi:hypothetical protein